MFKENFNLITGPFYTFTMLEKLVFCRNVTNITNKSYMVTGIAAPLKSNWLRCITRNKTIQVYIMFSIIGFNSNLLRCYK